ncbi:MAG: tRNA (adenosine(37)-N6)-threonylcarbamoyltransferase complex dimerization subunit type 1 TsaB [Myxococcota bacterium]
MWILAVDTAGPVVGVAVKVGERTLVREDRLGRGTEKVLVPWIDALMNEAGVSSSEPVGIGLTNGPGAFTSLRVGMATALGLATAWKAPVWLGCSLLTRAKMVHPGRPVVSALDARKGRLYAARYGADGREIMAPADLPPDVVAGWVESGDVMTGEGIAVYQDVFARTAGAMAQDATTSGVAALAELAAWGLANGEGKNPAEVLPRYIRPPDAVPPKRRSLIPPRV